MELTQEHLEIATGAYVANLDGNGGVVADTAYPSADELAEAGWLERRFEPNGDMSWWWTPAAETALDLSALMQGADGRQN